MLKEADLEVSSDVNMWIVPAVDQIETRDRAIIPGGRSFSNF